MEESFTQRGRVFRAIVTEPTVHTVSGELALRYVCRFTRRLGDTSAEVVKVATHRRRGEVVVTIRVVEVERTNKVQ